MLKSMDFQFSVTNRAFNVFFVKFPAVDSIKSLKIRLIFLNIINRHLAVKTRFKYTWVVDTVVKRNVICSEHLLPIKARRLIYLRFLESATLSMCAKTLFLKSLYRFRLGLDIKANLNLNLLLILFRFPHFLAPHTLNLIHPRTHKPIPCTLHRRHLTCKVEPLVVGETAYSFLKTH